MLRSASVFRPESEARVDESSISIRVNCQCSNIPILSCNDLTATSIPLMSEKRLEILPKSTYAPAIATQHALYTRMFHNVYRHTPIRNLVVTRPHMLRANIRPWPSARSVGLLTNWLGFHGPIPSPPLFVDTQDATQPVLHPMSPADRAKWLCLHTGFRQSHWGYPSHSP